LPDLLKQSTDTTPDQLMVTAAFAQGAAQMQMLRQMRLQSLGIGALATSQPAAASTPEQSNEPSPGVRRTQDGAGGGWTQSAVASE
jgi:hypothetical protein